MSHAGFVVAFVGAGAEGRIDVRDLAPALLSLGQAIDAANLAINGERLPARIEVKALGEGSFEVSLDVVPPTWEYLKSLVSSDDAAAAKTLLEWIGILGGSAASLFTLYRLLKGRKPDRVERAPNGTISIVIGHERLTVPLQVLRLYQDIAVNASLKKLLATLVIFTIFGAIAEFEREIIRERARAGLDSARARGRKGGRPPALSARDLVMAKAMLRDPALTVEEVARTLGVGPATLYRHLPGGRGAVAEAAA